MLMDKNKLIQPNFSFSQKWWPQINGGFDPSSYGVAVPATSAGLPSVQQYNQDVKRSQPNPILDEWMPGLGGIWDDVKSALFQPVTQAKEAVEEQVVALRRTLIYISIMSTVAAGAGVLAIMKRKSA